MNHLFEWSCNDRSISDGAKCDVYADVVARDSNITTQHPFTIFLDKVVDNVPHSLQIILQTHICSFTNDLDADVLVSMARGSIKEDR